MSLADGLEGIDSACIFLPVLRDRMISIKIDRDEGRGELLHDLHDFAETTLAHDFQQVKVLQLQAALLVLHKRDANFD